jgi:putative uncharacterized protein (fragment)
LEWLGFPSPGNHDDRTLLVLCGNTLTESEPTDDASAATTASQDESEATPPTPEPVPSDTLTVSALAPSTPAESAADVPVAVMDEPTSALTPSDTSSDIPSYRPMVAESTPNTPETTSELQQPEMEQLSGSSVVLNGKGSKVQLKAPKGKKHNKRNKRH